MANSVSESEKSGFWGLLFIAVGVTVGFATAQFEPTSMAEAAGFSAALIVFLNWAFWHERRKRWFWAYMAFVVIAHAYVLNYTPWPDHWKIGKEDGLYGLSDLILMFVFGYFLSTVIGKPRPAKPKADNAAK